MLDALLKTGNPWLIAGAIFFVAGGYWVNFGYMRKNMVTKKDFKLGFAEFSLALNKEMEDKFVTKDVFDAVVSKEKPNGHAKSNRI